jgi:CheY-like chemotaxis protein
MPKSERSKTILVADDDGEDCSLVSDALHATERPLEIHFVRNGEELFDYLRHQGEYVDVRSSPPPDLILLDLRMPLKDGRETIGELKTDPIWRAVPVIALTTSTASADIEACYRLGVNSYITKPATFQAWVNVFETVATYWFDIVKLPPKNDGGTPH